MAVIAPLSVVLRLSISDHEAADRDLLGAICCVMRYLLEDSTPDIPVDNPPQPFEPVVIAAAVAQCADVWRMADAAAEFIICLAAADQMVTFALEIVAPEHFIAAIQQRIGVVTVEFTAADIAECLRAAAAITCEIASVIY